MDYYIFLILTIFGTCRGYDDWLVPISQPETRIMNIIDDFVGSDNISETYIAAYYELIKERNDEIMNLNLLIGEREKQISYYEKEVIKCYLNTSSCVPFENFTGKKQIYLPHNDEPLNVICNNEVAGSGWIVIQQRINGKVSFDRNWADYSQGFGSFDGDFFLGLENIHRLTSSHRHELYIYVRAKSQIVEYARYDKFEIAGEDEQYKLISLGNYTGNDIFDKDHMRVHENMMFYTFDRDNDMKCSRGWHGGWWFHNCGFCNLNGHYGQSANGLNWGSLHNITKVLMLIRPKID